MSSSRPKTRADAKAAQQRQASRAATAGANGAGTRAASKGKGNGNGNGKGTSKGSRGRRWAKWLGIAALAGLLLAIVAFIVAYTTIKTPQPNDLASAQASIIYYADGKTEMARISEVNRESVSLSKVPKPVQQAHLAAEDRNFY